MRTILPWVLLVVLTLLFSACQGNKETAGYNVPVKYYKLDNGLKVVLSHDATAPIVTVAVYYNIGLRIEPRNRTGFAHLFEHMMFQGSQNLGKMEFIRLIQKNGGVLNGSTRFDFTNYFQIVPAHKLETILWAEADRMKGLDITEANLKNQQEVVKNEVKVNVMNQPYGGFPWLDMPQHANSNWYNAHNFYGELDDLDAATLEDVKTFFKTYYAPNNAVLVVVGDFDDESTKELIKKYFEGIPSVKQPKKPDINEPRQEVAKRATQPDSLATRPAFAFAYHMPGRNTPEFYAMAVLDQILLQGEDGMLYEALVKNKGMTNSVSGGINLLGNMFDYSGPMLWTGYLFHDAQTSDDAVKAVVDSVIEQVRSTPVDKATLDRAMVKFRSSFYDMVNDQFGFGRANLLACFALFDDDPSRINNIEAEIRNVTPELLQRTAQDYLRPTNQTVLTVKPTQMLSKEEQQHEN
ncbi:MAG TPA: insulinase family protein [Bacteroidetes bacterium]|nr:insulinase family protein [Bacteroidota bacterium]